MKLLKDNMQIDFVSKMKNAIVLSAVLVVVGLVFFIGRGEKNFGIDFTGGLLQQVAFKRPVSVPELRASLKTAGLEDASIQEVRGEGRMFILKTPVDSKSVVDGALDASFAQNPRELIREEMVGPAVGKDLKRQGFLALFFALLGILIYVSFRFEFRFAVGAIVALFHDVLITVGVLAILQVEISLQVLAALLTIVGYSLNDTIVVFDRIRESFHFARKEKYAELINKSINQTLNRTLLTSLTTLFVVLCLALFGGEVINSFAIALLIGVAVGTYSSVFVASTVLVYWRES